MSRSTPTPAPPASSDPPANGIVSGTIELAVEVVAQLGDSVIGVKHCINPRGGRVRSATWALMAGGAVCLVASALAFSTALHRAAADRARLDAWLRIEHKPAYAFRPHRLGPGVDALAFGATALAVIGLGLGISRWRRERVRPGYWIGSAPGVDLAIAGAPAPAFPLVAASGDAFVVRAAPGLAGELIVGGAVELPIPRDGRIVVRAGAARIAIAAVVRPRRHRGAGAFVERRTLVYVAASLAAHAAIWALLAALPPDTGGVVVELPSTEPIAASLRGTTREAPPPPPTSESPTESPGEQSGDAAPGNPAMALPPGASGDPSAPDLGHPQLADAGVPPQLSREQAIAEAREAGVLGSRLLSSGIDALAASDIASGIGLLSADGLPLGISGYGRGGFGDRRSEMEFATCADLACGPAFHGRYAASGPGWNIGGRYDLPGRGVGLPPYQPELPRTSALVATGAGYDKAVIRRYIRRQIDKITYCYEKQLLGHADLGGEILVRFLIAPDGSVQSASATGFDAEVGRCIAGVIQVIAFPRPPGGSGSAEVHYPFQFHAAGR